MTDLKPLVIAVAPNGARHTKQDHPALPITPSELVQTAVECLEAGARMIHLHVRDKSERHSLLPKDYITAVKAVKAAVASEMIVQVTSEAAGIYNSAEQIDLMQQLMPDCISIALREFVPENTSVAPFKNFLKNLAANNCLIQYILYDEVDFRQYQKLIASKVIPLNNHSLLFVLGRYTKTPPEVDIVQQYRSILETNNNWMVCSFGVNAPEILAKTVDFNCQIRVGFENGFYLPDGTTANSNADLVAQSWQSYKQSGRKLATIDQTRELLGQNSN
ncbi:MAG: 3-keto-5-aminohexanoate cleavage protein [Gammaproteobacteria bacterium]|nr:3-keto-5-aminohexanoate cleavage protein [Gammaproteobacteria bacterium]